MAPLPPPSAATVAAIYAAYEADTGSGFREHLGASIIGTECERALWYDFRWATRATHSGRLLRLFQTGHLAEERFVADLRRIGVTVLEVDPENGKQWSVRDDTGHFGGSLDGVLQGMLEAPKAWHVAEFKTHSTKSFEALKTKGVEKSKPMHWAQMQVYMHMTGIDRALYLAVNKNDDELYQERIHADAAAAMRLIAKAQRIIAAKRPPGRISEDPAWWQCRFCNHHAVCHESATPERHCRSCIYSTPVDAGRWICGKHMCGISGDGQRVGCVAHLYIPDLVHGEQVDAGEDWIAYRMPDGGEWRDGVQS